MELIDAQWEVLKPLVEPKTPSDDQLFWEEFAQTTSSETANAQAWLEDLRAAYGQCSFLSA